MSKFEKLLEKLLSGRSDSNIDFTDLLKIATEYGFELRVKGSHHILTKPDVPEIINLQPKGRYAKAYQAKQVREMIIKYKLSIDLQNDTDDE